MVDMVAYTNKMLKSIAGGDMQASQIEQLEFHNTPDLFKARDALVILAKIGLGDSDLLMAVHNELKIRGES